MSYSISNISIKVFAAIVAFASLSAASFAQGSPESVKVKVPFSFETASAKVLPAGTYTLHVEGQHIISIRGASSSLLALISPEQNRNLDETEHGKLVFEKQGGRYYLRQVWMAGQSFHSNLGRSRKSRPTERASNEAAASTNVEVAALEVIR